jgi:hypothetical protein
VTFLGREAAAEFIAYWNFNSYDGSAITIPASLGSGTLTVTGFPADDLLVLPGTTVNALGVDLAGNALGLENNLNNGDFLTLAFSMSGYKDLVLTYATRRTSTGFNSNQWAYSTDGLSFTPLGSPVNPTTSTTFSLITRDFSSVSSLNDDSTVFLRYTLNGATNSSGNNRMDNIQLNASPTATVVSEPSAIVMMGLGMLGLSCAAKRRW